MKKQSCCLLVVFLAGCSTIPKQPSEAEWVQLFNGKDLSGWQMKIRGYTLGDNFANTFRVKDGNLAVGYDGYTQFDEKFGHIFYEKKFGNYLLGLEYRFIGEQAPGGPGWAFRNSGAMLHCQDPATMLVDQDFPISIEVQLLGGNGTDERTTANLCTPGTNVVMDDKLFTNHCINSGSRTYHGDQWVRVDVLVLGDSVMEHYVGGDLVLKYHKPQIGGGNVSPVDPAVKKDGMLLESGFISLQSESHPVEFRKVELLDLAPYARNAGALQALRAKIGKR